ncbi:hypothetical protein CCACVL1_07214 [Corchorus capsularis]|uniref:Uncharacterized protein n=1 Tax=Corchorus capsularis TaxID=210143 RepID=A0A1R3J8H0_COCAP|nr:hypothetical protein CCACVL1_07214 [Corchorus capsularis]
MARRREKSISIQQQGAMIRFSKSREVFDHWI